MTNEAKEQTVVALVARVLNTTLAERLPTEGTFVYGGVTGSRLFNLDVPGSDTDLLLVWASPLRFVLGLSATDFVRKHTLKNEDTTLKPDYLVVEVRQFAAQLLDCTQTPVECLFATATHGAQTAGFCSQFWAELVERRQEFVTKRLVEKYMDHLARECSALRDEKTAQVPSRVIKKTYLVQRLINTLSSLREKGVPKVWHEDGSTEKEAIMRIRRGEAKLEEVLEEAEAVRARIRTWLASPDCTLLANADGMAEWLEDWTFRVRAKEMMRTLERIGEAIG